ncbi:MAG: DsbA family protein [Halanaeroarchaeum sp.]
MPLPRRDFLRVGVSASVAGLAGCLNSGGSLAGQTVESLPTPTLGAEDAPVTVKAFEDYACHHCRNYVLQTLPKIRSTYVESGIVRYEHHDFPIPVDETWSYQAASAARAVQDTVGTEAFFEFSRGLYENFGEYTMNLLGHLAGEVGADPQTIQDAARNLTYKPVLAADRKRGVEMGVRGTPAIFVEGTLLPAYDWATVSSAIESARVD